MSDAHNEDLILRVSASSAPQSVAAAISKSITDSHHYPTLRAIGHGAVGQMAKACAIARGYLSPRGIDIVVIPGFDTVQNAEDKPISAITFKVIER